MKSLQDQLLAAGLVDEKRARELAQESRRSRREAKGGKAAPKTRRDDQSEAGNKARQAAAAAELRRKDSVRRKAVATQVEKIVAANRLPRREATAPFRFVIAGRVKHIHVTAAQRDQILAGDVSIVAAGRRFELVAGPIAQQIRALRPAAVIALAPEGSSDAPDDEFYKDFDVPDDLTW